MGGVVFLSCLLFGMGSPSLELAGYWVELGLLVLRQRSLGELLQIDNMWARISLLVQCPELSSPTSEAQA